MLKRKETNETSLTRKNAIFYLEAFSGTEHGEEEAPAEHGGLTELKRQRSNSESMTQLGFVWQSTRVEGAAYRKSSRNLHRLDLLLITKEHMCRVAIHKAGHKTNRSLPSHCKLSNSWSLRGAEGHSSSYQLDRRDITECPRHLIDPLECVTP